MYVYKNVLEIIFIFNKILYVNRIVIMNMLIQYLIIYVIINVHTKLLILINIAYQIHQYVHLITI